jgi:hypothetical protein
VLDPMIKASKHSKKMEITRIELVIMTMSDEALAVTPSTRSDVTFE